jgi:hypothetical protein
MQDSLTGYSRISFDIDIVSEAAKSISLTCSLEEIEGSLDVVSSIGMTMEIVSELSLEEA